MQKRCSQANSYSLTQSSGGGHAAIKTAINPMDSPPSSAGLFSSLLLVLLLCCLPLSRRGGAHMLLDQMCVDAGNYTPDSTYESNLRRLLPSLSSAASASSVGFFSASTGESPDRISGLGLCRGDINATDCHTCLDGASVDAVQLCPHTKTAVIWYDHCLLRYSDRKLTSAFDNSEQVFTYNAVNITGGRFPGYGQNTAIYDFVNEAVNALLSDLADSAASNSNTGKLFASGELTITSGFPTIHALVQCAPDMSGPECRRCIQGQISETLSVFDGRQGGRVLGVWCNLRYEAYTFNDGYPTRSLSSIVSVDLRSTLSPDPRVLLAAGPYRGNPYTTVPGNSYARVPAGIPYTRGSSAPPTVPTPSTPASSAPPTVPAPPPSASSATPTVPAPPRIPPPASAAPLTAPAPPRIPPPGSSAPLRLPAPPQFPTASPRPGPPPGKKKLRVIIIITTCLTVLLISCCLLCLLYIKRGRRAERATFNFDTDEVIKLWKSEESSSEFTLFDFATISNSTNNFSIKNKLGEGGFGPVYKGLLSNGLEIAIKRLSARSGQGLVEFKNEIKLIAKLQHRNLVRLLGCCIQGEEKILIYEYMPNKSLDFFIFDQTRGATLDWQKRFTIVEGIAQGLLYLHKHSRLRIIHRDLKASNILLDSEMYPKISDFGLARIFGTNETQANTNRVVGTYGYMSPEYAAEGIFSVKSDVFSFGVLLLEIVSGKRNAGFHQYGNHLNLLGYAWEIWKDGRWFELIDPSLDGGSKTNEILRCIHVALMCVQENAADRPTMSDVIAMLSSDRMNLPDPKHPAYFNVRINDEAEMASNFIVPVSNNEITFTGLEGR